MIAFGILTVVLHLFQSRTANALGRSAQFVNYLDMDLRMDWIGFNNERVYSGMVSKGTNVTIFTYVDHMFELSNAVHGYAKNITILENQVVYSFLDENSESNFPKKFADTKRFLEFNEEYFKTNNRNWRGYWPKRPVPLYMWQPDEESQTCNVDNEEFEVTTVSNSPKLFQVMNVVSKEEIQHIISEAKRSQMVRSVIEGGGLHDSRTSQQVWLDPEKHPVVDRIYERIAKIVKIPRQYLDRHAENLQVVHYTEGQKYNTHHDWDQSKNTRYLTFLLYLTDKEDEESGGETEFPHIGIKVHPGAGNGVFFYNLLEDGSCDERSSHGALEVKRGEKWLCNVWIRDGTQS